ncbi:MAG: hypothetical protein RBR20_04510, partial [Desulfobacterales bacterium]|nr:hypothetical protein [Desulfobacterales bacterium]
VNANSADLSAGETLLAAVTGQNIYLERIWISAAAAITVTIRAGADVLIGPLYCAANSTVDLILSRQIQLPAATALTAITSGAGNVTIVAQGVVR